MAAIAIYSPPDGKGNIFGLIMSKTGDQLAEVSLLTWSGGHTPGSKPDAQSTYNVTGALVDAGVFKGSTWVSWLWAPEPAKLKIAPATAGMTPGYTLAVSPDVPLAPGGHSQFVGTTADDWQALVDYFKSAGWPAS